MWSLYGIVLVGVVSYGKPVANISTSTYLVSERPFRGPPTISIASIERDANIVLELHIIVLTLSLLILYFWKFIILWVRYWEKRFNKYKMNKITYEISPGHICPYRSERAYVIWAKVKELIRCEVWIAQWFRAVARKAKDSLFDSRWFQPLAPHIFLVHEYCLPAIIRWAEKCECSLHRICVHAVTTDGFCRLLTKWAYRHVWPPPTYISIFTMYFTSYIWTKKRIGAVWLEV